MENTENKNIKRQTQSKKIRQELVKTHWRHKTLAQKPKQTGRQFVDRQTQTKHTITYKKPREEKHDNRKTKTNKHNRLKKTEKEKILKQQQD